MRRIRAAFSEYLYDSSVNVKDRSFVVFSFVLIAELIFGAIPLGILMKEPISSSLATFAGAVFFGLYVFYAIKKDKIGQAKIVISIILIFIFLPVMFFTNGGVYGGAPVSLLLGGIYINMILVGKLQIVMNILYSLSMILCWIVGYLHPEMVTQFEREGVYIDSISGLLIVNIVIILLMTFHTKLYERENEIAEQKTREAEELNRTQSHFFSSMSHEIRTPINTVLGLNEIILRQEDASEEIRRDARNIQGAGKMLLALINDILDVSKIEAGKMTIVPVEYSVGDIVSEMVNMIWLKANEKGLEFKVDIDPNIPSVLFGDEVRIKQILINILNNAVKYTHEGSITLHMESERIDEDNILLKITISDTGMGIPPEAIPHLFDSFQRVDEEKNRYIEGTGLGMSIVKQLIDLMGGDISVNSVYAKGSAFTVTLKQKIVSDTNIGNLQVAGGAGESSGAKFEHSFYAPDARILIVDDNEMNLEVEEKLLSGTEITIDLITSGKEALKMTLKHKYDVIFMDHLMPEMDGIECFEEIKKQKGGLNKEVPVIVLTANAGGENKTLYNDVGFNGYLVKPVSGKQLEETLINFLPEEKVIRNENIELAGGTMNTAAGYSKKKSVIITTSSMSDLPESVVKAYQIGIIPFVIITDQGVFWDGVETVSDELIRYINEGGKNVQSGPPIVKEFREFFAAQLKKAHQVIHITVTSSMSKEYANAMKATEAMENVTIVDSESLSTATGLLTLIAAKMAARNEPVEEIVKEIEAAKKRIHCSFVIANTDFMTRGGHLTERTNRILKSLWIRPSLHVKNNVFGVDRLLMGNLKKCYETYIKRALPKTANPERDVLFITYADIAEEHLLWIVEQVEKRFTFDRIIIQKASAAISSNCGPGTFGLLYMDKGDISYNIGSMIPKETAESEVEEEKPETTIEEEEAELVANELQAILDQADDLQEQVTEEMVAPKLVAVEPKWYDSLTDLDAEAAIKNSGSEEIFKSVIKLFYDSANQKESEIRGFYDSEDWENYTIKVHALKSSSRLIGAMDLGREAESLEMAGKSRDIDYIKANNDRVMEMFESVRDALKSVCGGDGPEAEDKPEAEDFMMEGFFDMVKEAAQKFDYDGIENAFSDLEGYRIPEKDKELFNTIREGFDIIDYDSILNALDKRV